MSDVLSGGHCTCPLLIFTLLKTMWRTRPSSSLTSKGRWLQQRSSWLPWTAHSSFWCSSKTHLPKTLQLHCVFVARFMPACCIVRDGSWRQLDESIKMPFQYICTTLQSLHRCWKPAKKSVNIGAVEGRQHARQGAGRLPGSTSTLLLKYTFGSVFVTRKCTQCRCSSRRSWKPRVISCKSTHTNRSGSFFFETSLTATIHP